MAKLHIKKGDTVYVNSGEDKGKTGRVLKVLVKEGEEVEEHQPLIVIEAMKMETNIVSKTNGKIKSIKVKEGEMVSDKQLLMTLE